jgi:hypothetical protein
VCQKPKQIRKAAVKRMTQSAAVKTNGKPATEENAVMEVVKTETKVQNAILSLEKRIQRVQELNIVIDKWRKLSEARQNLNEFKLANDGLSNAIVIKDSSGREFKTNQPLVYNAVIKAVQEVLDDKIAETEVQINFQE